MYNDFSSFIPLAMISTWKEYIEEAFESSEETWDDVVYCSVPMEILETEWGDPPYVWEVIVKDRYTGEKRKMTVENRAWSVDCSRNRIMENHKFLTEVVSMKNITKEYPFEGVDFRLWTEKFVYFPHEYDSMFSVRYVLRNPTEMHKGVNENLFETIQ